MTHVRRKIFQGNSSLGTSQSVLWPNTSKRVFKKLRRKDFYKVVHVKWLLMSGEIQIFIFKSVKWYTKTIDNDYVLDLEWYYYNHFHLISVKPVFSGCLLTGVHWEYRDQSEPSSGLRVLKAVQWLCIAMWG